MNKISAVIITYNEEENIERCLISLKDVVDEIIIVDSFSTDKTEEICLKHDVKFVKHAFKGHIEQKNWAITQAENDYVLSLDADEVLSAELQQSIIEAKKDLEFDGYYFNRLNNYCGKWIKHMGWYPDKKMRLWNSTKGKWGGVNPHDKYELYDGCSSKYLKGDLLHYSYNSIEQHLDQANKFSTIGAEAAFKRGKRSSTLGIIIKTAWKFKRDYIFKLGFLDGFYGLVISVISAHATFLKYAKLRKLNREKNS